MSLEQVERSAGTLSTGIESLDRRLNGGIQAGSVVAFLTPPAAQSHTVLQQLMRERPTVYISTLRSHSAIENQLRHGSDIDFDVTIREVGSSAKDNHELVQELSGSEIHSLNTTERDTLLDDVYDIVTEVEGTVNVIVDTANPLERSDSRSAYQKLLKELSTILLETDSLAVLHCTNLDDDPEFRESTLTVADVVWELDVVSGRKENLEIQTRIPKNRGGEAVLEQVSLILRGDDVYTDDSRNI